MLLVARLRNGGRKRYGRRRDILAWRRPRHVATVRRATAAMLTTLAAAYDSAYGPERYNRSHFL